MKRTVKFLAGAAALISLLAMTACGAKQDPKALYDAAIKKNQELTSLEMSSDMTMTMTVEDQTMDMTSKSQMKMDGLHSDAMHYIAETTSTMMGTDTASTMFYTDGYAYLESAGQKFKYPMDMESLMKQVESASGGALDSSILKTIKASKDGDSQVLTFTIDPDKMNSQVQEMMGSLGSAMGSLDSMEMKVSEASGTLTVNKDGYYTAETMKLKMDVTANGQTIGLDMSIDAVIVNPGQEVTVEIPDTEGYTEIASPLGA